MTDHVRVVATAGTTELFDGDCGVVLQVLVPCPDEPHGSFRCACGAEILPRTPTAGQSAPKAPDS